MRTALVAIPLVLLAAVVMLLAFQRQLLFPRHMIRAPDQPRGLPDGGEQWWLETPEGDLEAWYLKGDGRSEAHPGPAVVFGHGNGEVIDHWPRLMRWYADRGIGVLLVEYRGYGRSAGRPSSDNITDDFAAYRQRLADRPEVDAGRLIYHGRSLGGGAVCNLARRHPPAAFILQSTFTSLADMAWHHYFAPSFVLRDEFDNIDYVSETDVPILITHGRRDDIIPIQQARQLHEAAANSTFVELEGGHNDGEMPWDRIESFLTDESLL